MDIAFHRGFKETSVTLENAARHDSSVGFTNCYFCSYLNISDTWSDEETVSENKFEAKIDVFIRASTWIFIPGFVTFM